MGEYPPMQLIPDAVTKRAAALGTTAQNVLEVARFGGLETGEEPAPVRVVARGRVYRLRRYFPEQADGRAGPAGPARAAADAQRRGLGRVAVSQRGARSSTRWASTPG